MDEKTIKAFEELIAGSEAAAAKALRKLAKAVESGDSLLIHEAFNEWNMFDEQFVAQSSTFEILKEEFGF